MATHVKIRLIPALAAAVMATVLAAACAGSAERADESVYLDHAGEPVSQVRFMRLIDWRVAGDDLVALRAGGDRHFLVRVAPPCPAELRFATRLAVLNRMPNLLATFDRLRLDDTECNITEIREYDRDAVRAVLDRAA